MIWVSCEGENSADREHIGNVTYTPFRGFPAYYFPYKNIPGYLSPIVALQFQKPEGTSTWWAQIFEKLELIDMSEASGQKLAAGIVKIPVGKSGRTDSAAEILNFYARHRLFFRVSSWIINFSIFISLTAGVLINIECKVWAKNIIHDRQRRLGSVHFELLMD